MAGRKELHWTPKQKNRKDNLWDRRSARFCFGSCNLIPKAQLPFLKPLQDQVNRKKQVDSKRKFRAKKYHAPGIKSAFKLSTLKPQINRYLGSYADNKK